VVQKLLSRDLVPKTFSISHSGKDEPLLSLADIVAGARTDLACANNEAIYPRIAHLVRETRQVD
jgi:hypothetical protein